MHVDDLADACVFLLRQYSGEEHVNVGTGSDVTIAELATTIASVTGFQGRIDWDRSKPDGTMQKRLDVRLINRMGWTARTDLSTGLRCTYRWFLKQSSVRT
jgi:GDP-L-fucose synthase